MEFVLDEPVIVMGDFNTVMDRKVDRFPLGIQTGLLDYWIYGECGIR